MSKVFGMGGVRIGWLDAFFRDHAGMFRWVRPRGGTVGFPRLLSEQSSYDFCEEVVRKAEIMLIPSRVLEYGDRHLRVGFGRADMPEVLERFDRYLKRDLTAGRHSLLGPHNAF